MKIVIVIDLIDTLTNGSVMTARRFADGLIARGHAVSIVAVGADGVNDVNVKERYVPLLTEVSAKNQIKFGKFEREKIKKVFPKNMTISANGDTLVEIRQEFSEKNVKGIEKPIEN